MTGGVDKLTRKLENTMMDDATKKNLVGVIICRHSVITSATGDRERIDLYSWRNTSLEAGELEEASHTPGGGGGGGAQSTYIILVGRSGQYHRAGITRSHDRLM